MIFDENLAIQTSKLLLQVNAIKLNIEKPFTWSSGIKSPIYCDNRLILSYPKIRKFISNEIAKFIKSKIQKDYYVAGVATGSIAIGVLIAEILKKPFIYVRPEPKAHGAGKQIEGMILKKVPVVVIEDLISTGNSSLMAINALRSEDLKVKGMISIFTYGFDISYENFKDKNIDFHSLSSYDYLLEQALDINYITDNEFKILKDWKKNPAQWKI